MALNSDEEQERLQELERKARRQASLEDLELRYRRAKREGDEDEAKRLKRQIWKLKGF